MLMRKLHVHGLIRLMAVWFAVQVMVGGLCLLRADAHAMPQSVQAQVAQTQDVYAHCAKFSHADDQHSHDYSDNCDHCDQSNQLSNFVVSYVAPIVLMLQDGVTLSTAPRLSSEVTGLFPSRTPTGPPRSSSLLYTLTQRIRV